MHFSDKLMDSVFLYGWITGQPDTGNWTVKISCWKVNQTNTKRCKLPQRDVKLPQKDAK